MDPPPDLVIEVDISNSSLDKLSIMADLHVPEVWHYDANRWRILVLQQGKYLDMEASVALSPVTAQAMRDLIDESRTTEPLAWNTRVRRYFT